MYPSPRTWASDCTPSSRSKTLASQSASSVLNSLFPAKARTLRRSTSMSSSSRLRKCRGEVKVPSVVGEKDRDGGGAAERNDKAQRSGLSLPRSVPVLVPVPVLGIEW